MRFQYSTNDPSQDEFDSLPRIPLILRHNNQRVEVIGLVDSGATVNVLPYQIGIQLGLVWDDSKAIIRLAGNIGNQPAMPVFFMAEIAEFAPVRLVFAWAKSDTVSLILGQTNFFLEFDVHFYRSRLEFDIEPKR
ncbi:hypothetical protein QUB68_11630 [Microcoleus sp. A006_D1]|uniref:hypothetical protein n=1 Tax=Microcoleus sp. A006_D1 TaxID=3055267 RepID=UPI002FD20252